MAGEVSAVFPDHCDVHGKSAAHGFINNLFELKLREAAFGPKALKDFAAMFDLDKGAGFTVSTSPDGHEFAARFHGPGRGLDQVRDLYSKFIGLGVEYLNG